MIDSTNLFDDLDEDMPKASPFEALFDLTPGSTKSVLDVSHQPVTLPTDAFSKMGGALVDPSTGEIMEQSVDADVEALEKEDRLEDLKLQAQLNTVHDAAMGAFHAQHAMSQEVDPKFSARNSEVAAQYLTIALSSISARSEAKYKRQKMRLAKNMGATPNSVQNNVIVTDRNSLLRNLFKPDFEQTMTEQIKGELSPTKD